jgi:hypothetical protein
MKLHPVGGALLARIYCGQGWRESENTVLNNVFLRAYPNEEKHLCAFI